MRLLRRAITDLGIVALLLASAPGCSRTDHGEHEALDAQPRETHEEGVVQLGAEALARAGIRIESVAERPLPLEIETTGQVGLDETRLAHVSPRIPGRVLEVLAELGREVRKGDVLAEIDSIELGKAKAEFLRARAMESPARRNHEREEKLFADRITSEREVLAAEAELREATANLRAAEETLHLYGLEEAEIRALDYENRKASVFSLRSPLAGKIVEKHASVGELVSPEKNLFTVADLSRVWIWIDIYENVIDHVHLDDDVEVQLDSVPDVTFNGKLTYLGDRVDPDTRAVRARVDVDNAAQKLRPGMFARVRVSDPHDAFGRREAPALTVPSDAVLRDGEELVVFVPLAPNRFARRPVEIGHKGERWTEIRRGLVRGDRVAVSGGFLLKSEASKEAMGEGHSH